MLAVADGDLVELSGSSLRADGELVASSVALEAEPLADSRGLVEIEGYVTTFDARTPATFTLAGARVATTPETFYYGGVHSSVGLNARMAPLAPLFASGELAIVHACGSHDPTRSHFDAQDYMESGTPGVKSTRDGWLNRYLHAKDHERDNLVLESHRVEIADARQAEPSPSLDREGFTLVLSPTAVTDFTDSAAVDAVYPGEIEAMLRRLTGADHVVARGTVLRFVRQDRRDAFVNSLPAGFVHVDTSRESFADFAARFAIS